MQSYQAYKAGDFLTDDSFIAWVCHRDAEATGFWTNWMEQAHSNRSEALLAKDILEALVNQEPPVRSETLTQETAQIMRRVRNSGAETGYPAFPMRFSRRWAAGIGLLFLLGAAWLVWGVLGMPPSLLSFLPTHHPPDEVVEQVNHTRKPVRVALPDGSSVLLQAHSRVQHRVGFGREYRAVILTGDADFEIASDTGSPFLLYTGDIVARATGSGFSVKTAHAQTVLSVRNGLVTVYTRKEFERRRNDDTSVMPGVVLTPNQQVVYRENRETFEKQLVAKPVPLTGEATSLEFTDAPLPAVLAKLRQTFGIDIVCDEKLLEKCRLTASLTGIAFFEQLRIICDDIGAYYEITDGKVILTTAGCREPGRVQ
ncbi:FecR family protein [Larkinella soli]|uniref:FecR family protein n=1 Tax=Larkinella soli TaxID=1770527 RepID=UPI0013E365C0|nr:FecR family protein [Larkinella soli]